jgi:hypothetical protein
MSNTICELFSLQHLRTAAPISRSFRAHHAKARLDEQTALKKLLSPVGEPLVQLYMQPMLEVVKEMQETSRFYVWQNGHINPGTDTVLLGPHHEEVPEGGLVSRAVNFRLTVTRSEVQSRVEAGKPIELVEAWRLHIGAVCLEAVAVALELVRELQSTSQRADLGFTQGAKFGFTQLTVSRCYIEVRRPADDVTRALLHRSLTFLLHEMRLPVSDEHLGRLRTAPWTMWSNKEDCCSYFRA